MAAPAPQSSPPGFMAQHGKLMLTIFTVLLSTMTSIFATYLSTEIKINTLELKVAAEEKLVEGFKADLQDHKVAIPLIETSLNNLRNEVARSNSELKTNLIKDMDYKVARSEKQITENEADIKQIIIRVEGLRSKGEEVSRRLSELWTRMQGMSKSSIRGLLKDPVVTTYHVSTPQLIKVSGEYTSVANMVQELEVHRHELESMYTKEISYWPNGAMIDLVLFKLSSYETSDFVWELFGVTISRFKERLDIHTLTGEGTAPTYVQSEQEMLFALRDTVYALGFLRNAVYIKNDKGIVKIIVVDTI